MNKIMPLLLIMMFQLSSAFAQAPAPTCDTDDHDDIDFWVGTWDAIWEGGSGTNEITKEYGGCVIHENFKGSNLKGMSISTYVKPQGTWRQIWMDEQNGFLDLYGKKDGDNYIFHTTPNKDNADFQLQMVFSEIKENSFTWRWQSTNDGGANWQTNWQISYKRAQ